MTPTLPQLSGPQFPHPQVKGEQMSRNILSGSDIICFFFIHSLQRSQSFPQGNKEHNAAQGRQSVISEPLEHLCNWEQAVMTGRGGGGWRNEFKVSPIC